jgi:long-chain fatty acid transport protein
LALSLITVAASAWPARAQYGLLFSGTGPVNRAMGGVSVATAADATGGLFWNPATISGLERSELDFGVELLYPRTRLASSIPAGALGPIGPPIPFAGSDKGDNGVFPLPSMGLVFRPEESAWTFGLGIFEVGGFGVNYPASNFNPVLTPQPPVGVGLGSVYSQLQVFEFAPSISYQLTGRLTVGFGPTFELANLKLDPAVIAPPDAAAGGLFARYPIGTHTRSEWGVGVQGGITFALNNDWRLGGSLKSPRWFEKFGFNSADELGRPRHFTFDADLPLVAALHRLRQHAGDSAERLRFSRGGARHRLEKYLGLGPRGAIPADRRLILDDGLHLQRRPHRQRPRVLQRCLPVDY